MATPLDGETPAPTATPDRAAQRYEQARAALARWDEVLRDTRPDPLVLTSPLTRGGGWRGRDAGDQKSAFYAGLVQAIEQLPTDPPPSGEVVWRDGTTRAVELMSAADALDHLATYAEGGSCIGCRPLEVVGARLTTRRAATTRGPAVVPVWKFIFTDRDEPLVPITEIALDDREYIALDHWPELDHAQDTEFAVGQPESTELTVAFTGPPWRGDNPCGADYTAEAVESESAVVVIVRGHRSLPSPAPTDPVYCPLVGATRTATASLAGPLGYRTVLDLSSGRPVALFPELPDSYPSI